MAEPVARAGRPVDRPAAARGPDTFEALERLLRARYERFTPTQRRIAERLLSDPEGCAFLTVTELAEATGVNDSTVVRFATSLGLSGYPALVRLCRERLRAQAQLLERFGAVEYFAGADGDVRARAAAYDQTNIARTFARVSPGTWAQTVTTLATAPRVHVLGLRKCHTVAYLLSYLLGLVRDEVRLLTLGAGTLTDELRQVRAGDAFVAVSIHRYARATVQALRYARQRGAVTVALTDNPASPLAAHAEHCFYVDTAGVSVLRSVTAFISLTQALAAGVAAELGAETRSALRVEEQLLHNFDTYEAEENEKAAQDRDQRAGTGAPATAAGRRIRRGGPTPITEGTS
jgi:DNA-binding MurR/RpiR family transcriptional regulator